MKSRVLAMLGVMILSSTSLMGCRRSVDSTKTFNISSESKSVEKESLLTSEKIAEVSNPVDENK